MDKNIMDSKIDTWHNSSIKIHKIFFVTIRNHIWRACVLFLINLPVSERFFLLIALHRIGSKFFWNFLELKWHLNLWSRKKYLFFYYKNEIMFLKKTKIRKEMCIIEKTENIFIFIFESKYISKKNIFIKKIGKKIKKNILIVKMNFKNIFIKNSKKITLLIHSRYF